MKIDEPLSELKGNHFHRYLNYATSILSEYNGDEPFHIFLKKFFSANKKHGSRDRKLITSLCYNFFRLGYAVSPNVDMQRSLILAFFLIEQESSAFLENLKPEWNAKIRLDISSKLKMVEKFFSAEKIFSFPEELSDSINTNQYARSFLIQPKLFIRIRPGKKNSVFDKLKSANISFNKMSETCLALANNEKVSEIINIDKEVVIQDYNSQRTLDTVIKHHSFSGSSISIWDCCAASGGKSILAFDLLKNIELTVSDTRKSILEILKKRFAKAHILNYNCFVADLSTSTKQQISSGKYDLLIADVPCSGSGTWARTPEKLHFFHTDKIKEYSILQKEIVSNAAKCLVEDGLLLYITCSVFKKENEENVDFFKTNLNLLLLETGYLKGYEIRADTMFVALFKKQAVIDI